MGTGNNIFLKMGQDYQVILETYGTSEQVRAEPMLWENPDENPAP